MPWLIIFPIIVVLFMVAPLLIGFIVYKDAKKHNNPSPLVWALVASLVPFYIGLLLYVLIGNTQTGNGGQL
jgi:hypothetical protein